MRNRSGKDALEKDIHLQLNSNHKLISQIVEIETQVQRLTQLSTSQTDAESEEFARQGAEATAQSLRQNVKTLLTEIEEQKQIAEITNA